MKCITRSTLHLYPFVFFVQGMDMALSKLNSGGWVHIFPEGSRSRDGGKTIAPAKRGVGRLENHFPPVPSTICLLLSA